jgi:hypothetical protein
MQNQERQKRVYHIVAFSLGAAVFQHALNRQKSELPRLRTAQLLGAAISCDSQLNEKAIPFVAKCVNYHSQWLDLALNISYALHTGERAAGAVGLKNAARFLNESVECTHCWTQRSWDSLASRVASCIVHEPKPEMVSPMSDMNTTACRELTLRLISQDHGLVAFLEQDKDWGLLEATCGGKTFWRDLEPTICGWRVQKHKIARICRLLNQDNERKARWKSEHNMTRAFNRFAAERQLTAAGEYTTILCSISLK